MIEFKFFIFLMTFRSETSYGCDDKNVPWVNVNWNTRIALWVTNDSDSLGESFDFLPGNIFCFKSKYFSSPSRGREGREGSHDESDCLTEAWLGWAQSEFVHPFIHQLMDDWAWQAWQYHHPTISQSDTPRPTHSSPPRLTGWRDITSSAPPLF